MGFNFGCEINDKYFYLKYFYKNLYGLNVYLIILIVRKFE